MTGAAYSRVEASVWNQPWDDELRVFALYVLTCKHRTTEGFYELPLEYAAIDLRWPLERVQGAMRRLIEDGMVAYDPDARVILLVRALERQAPQNPNQAKAAARVVASLPKTPLRFAFAHLADRYSDHLSKVLRELLPEWFTEPVPKQDELFRQWLSEHLPHPHLLLSSPPTPAPAQNGGGGQQ